MSTFAIPLFFANTPGSSRPLQAAAPSYTNETNTAQSNPDVLIKQNIWAVDRQAAGINVDPSARGDTVTPAATPQNPAAPSPKDTEQVKQTAQARNPLVWIGVAAGVLVLFWAVRHA